MSSKYILISSVYLKVNISEIKLIDFSSAF